MNVMTQEEPFVIGFYKRWHSYGECCGQGSACCFTAEPTFSIRSRHVFRECCKHGPGHRMREVPRASRHFFAVFSRVTHGGLQSERGTTRSLVSRFPKFFFPSCQEPVRRISQHSYGILMSKYHFYCEYRRVLL